MHLISLIIKKLPTKYLVTFLDLGCVGPGLHGRRARQYPNKDIRHGCQTCRRPREAARCSRCRQQRAMLLRKPPSRASARCRSRCRLGPGPGRHLVMSPNNQKKNRPTNVMVVGLLCSGIGLFGFQLRSENSKVACSKSAVLLETCELLVRSIF